ncbi:hypothetical protein CAC42_5277 [Sphaceloma murrayae]|uniref:Uncharacterized protein n=1 Tax=Sphaceloma murrayae TaxID=2082308 RepID=A0A2K1QUJ2_9PEZI|nr:hypothetical protein CAC42_5277 [Sphaceloma murrayae]
MSSYISDPIRQMGDRITARLDELENCLGGRETNNALQKTSAAESRSSRGSNTYPTSALHRHRRPQGQPAARRQSSATARHRYASSQMMPYQSFGPNPPYPGPMDALGFEMYPDLPQVTHIELTINLPFNMPPRLRVVHTAHHYFHNQAGFPVPQDSMMGFTNSYEQTMHPAGPLAGPIGMQDAHQAYETSAMCLQYNPSVRAARIEAKRAGRRTKRQGFKARLNMLRAAAARDAQTGQSTAPHASKYAPDHARR